MSPPVDAIPNDVKLPESADVVVIGGGIIGVAAAYYLARKGLRVAVLEKGIVGGEQSSRNWGWCRAQLRALPEVPLAKAALDLWGGLDEELKSSTGFRRTGMLVVTKDPAEIANWEKWLAEAKDYEIPGGIVSAGEVSAMIPATSEKWIGGLYAPDDGRAEPSRAAPAYAEAARRAGVTIHQNCAARGWETTGGKISSVVTEKGSIRTSAILCAGGAWTSLLLRRQGISFPQSGVFATVFRTQPAPQVIEGGVGSPGFSFRRNEEGGYTVAMRGRGRVEITPQGMRYARQFLPMLLLRAKGLDLGVGRSLFDGPGAIASWRLDRTSPFERMRILDPAFDQSLVEEAMAQFRAGYPILKDTDVAESWGGYIDATPDAVPVISEVEKASGVYIASGFSGHGFGMAPAAARLAADLVTGDTAIVDPAPYRYGRFFDGTMHKAKAWV